MLLEKLNMSLPTPAMGRLGADLKIPDEKVPRDPRQRRQILSTYEATHSKSQLIKPNQNPSSSRSRDPRLERRASLENQKQPIFQDLKTVKKATSHHAAIISPQVPSESLPSPQVLFGTTSKTELPKTSVSVSDPSSMMNPKRRPKTSDPLDGAFLSGKMKGGSSWNRTTKVGMESPPKESFEASISKPEEEIKEVFTTQARKKVAEQWKELTMIKPTKATIKKHSSDEAKEEYKPPRKVAKVALSIQNSTESDHPPDEITDMIAEKKKRKKAKSKDKSEALIKKAKKAKKQKNKRKKKKKSSSSKRNKDLQASGDTEQVQLTPAKSKALVNPVHEVDDSSNSTFEEDLEELQKRLKRRRGSKSKEVWALAPRRTPSLESSHSESDQVKSKVLVRNPELSTSSEGTEQEAFQVVQYQCDDVDDNMAIAILVQNMTEVVHNLVPDIEATTVDDPPMVVIESGLGQDAFVAANVDIITGTEVEVMTEDEPSSSGGSELEVTTDCVHTKRKDDEPLILRYARNQSIDYCPACSRKLDPLMSKYSVNLVSFDVSLVCQACNREIVLKGAFTEAQKAALLA